MEACYIYNPKKLRRNVREICGAFGAKFNDFRLSYSFKTNSHPFVLETVRESGLLAEVVSPEEYSLALKTGFDASRVIYNGVCKDAVQLEECSLAGGIVNLDNEEDLDAAAGYFERTGNALSVGLRLNFYIGNHIKSRFGIETGSELYKRISCMEKEGIIRVRGLSCHYTNVREDFYWQKKAEFLAAAAQDFEGTEYLDFGGSLAGKYERLRGKDERCIKWDSVAEAIFRELSRHGLEDRRLILESGTAVVGSSFDLEADVLHIRENGFVVVDASYLDMMIPSLNESVQLEVIPCGKEQRMLRNFTLTGYTCLENDIIKRGFNGKLAVGDRIVFRNTGAYTLCMASSFIKPPLPVRMKEESK